jgi:transposase
MDRIGRRRAVSLFRSGLSRAEVARTLGVSRATATRWYRLWRTGGRAPGRAPRLGARDISRLHVALRAGPRASDLDLEEWNAAAVALVIERICGVRYHRRHIGRLLRRIGWVLPPIGRHASAAFRALPLRDPDGTPLTLRGR